VKTLLELDEVEARYGPVQALHGVSLTVGEAEVVAVLGANGAGKTTTLRAISGTVARSGAIELGGKLLRGGPEAAARAETFDPQRRKFIGNNPHCPTRTIGTTVGRSQYFNLGRRLLLAAIAKLTGRLLCKGMLFFFKRFRCH